MNKRITLLLCAILIVAFVFGACAKQSDLALPEAHDAADVPAIASPGPLPENDAAIVVMEVDGNKIYKDEFDAAYTQICADYGVAEDDPATMNLVQDATLDLLLSEEVLRIKLEEKGYMNLSEEDQALAEEQAQAELDYASSYSMSTILADLGEDFTQEDVDAAIIAFEDDLLAQYDLTRETFFNIIIKSIATDNAMADLLKDAVPSDEDVLAQYNNAVEADKAVIGDDLSIYEAYIGQNGMSHYTPEGVRFVRHILIRLDEESSQKVSSLRQTGDNEGADAALLQVLETIQEKADDVLAQLQAGDITFTDAIEQYNEDPGMQSNPIGYEIYEGCATYVESFLQGAMSLNKIGEITGLVASDYGYHIIEYSSDKPAGAIPLEEVEEVIYQSLLTTFQSEEWSKLIAQWKQEVQVTTYKEVL